jgi:hypothetical protein
VELHNIVMHCLSVLHKITGQVGDQDVCWLASYKQVLVQTVSMTLQSTWKQVVQDFEAVTVAQQQLLIYWLEEVNDYVEWLSGTELKLHESQLNLAFYDRLPGHWHMHYMIARQLVHMDNCPNLLCYFQVQQHKETADNKIEAKKEAKRAKLEQGMAILSCCACCCSHFQDQAY